jgi:hypothetical protein
MNKRVLGLLMLAFLVSVGSFAAAAPNTQFVPTRGMKGFKPSPRSAPAQVSRESEEEMKAKGFTRIGTFSIWATTKTYWHSTDLNVPVPPTRRDLTRELLQEAAASGGDFVTLTADNQPGTEMVSKLGKAIWWDSVSRETYFHDEIPHWRYVIYKVATDWETIHGVQCNVTSAGIVWRNDPSFPGQLAEWLKAVAEREKAERMAGRKRETRSFWLAGGSYYDPPRGVFPEGLKPFMNADELVGYTDRGGTTVIKPQFLFANNFSEGLAEVLADGQLSSFIDRTGTRVFVTPSDYWQCGDFREGMARVGVGASATDLKWGYMDTTGQLVIPAQFDEAGDFSEGLARVRIKGPLDNWGYKGPLDKWGYIDTTGEYVVSPQFLFAGDFREGLAPVTRYGQVHSGYIDPTGKWVIPDTLFSSAREFSEGLAPVEINLGTDKRVNFKWGYIDKQANLVIKAQFDEAFPFSDAMARVVKIKGWDTKKYGFIDRTGRMVVEPVYDKANDFWDGLTVAWTVWKGSLEKWTLKSTPAKILDKRGQIVGELDVLGTVRWMFKP